MPRRGIEAPAADEGSYRYQQVAGNALTPEFTPHFCLFAGFGEINILIAKHLLLVHNKQYGPILSVQIDTIPPSRLCVLCYLLEFTRKSNYGTVVAIIESVSPEALVA
jgi:hypothetical protein